MDKFSFIALWDVYNGLLTATQQEITDMYFNLDLTVSEIAKEKGISRQAVSDCLKGCKKQLEEWEDKLHFFGRIQENCLQFSFMLTDINRWAESFKKVHPELCGELSSLTYITEKDYSEEIKDAMSKPENIEVLNRDYTEKFCGRKKTGEE